MEQRIHLSRKQRRTIRKTVGGVLGIALSLFIAIPFLWMFWCAFQKNTGDMYLVPPKFPDLTNMANFLAYVSRERFLRELGATLLISISTMTIGTLSSIFVAYGFSRFKAPGKRIYFAILLSTMMLPWVVTMVPAYMLFAKVGLVGTYWPLIIPSIGGSAYNVFLLRQFMVGIPKELDEAAKIDGCGFFRILIYIILPNLKPIIATIIIFSFVGAWGDYVGPSIYILDPDRYTLALGLQSLRNGSGEIPWPMLLAGCVTYSLPIIAVFLSCQKAYVQGAIGSAIKS